MANLLRFSAYKEKSTLQSLIPSRVTVQTASSTATVEEKLSSTLLPFTTGLSALN